MIEYIENRTNKIFSMILVSFMFSSNGQLLVADFVCMKNLSNNRSGYKTAKSQNSDYYKTATTTKQRLLKNGKNNTKKNLPNFLIKNQRF